MDYHLQMKLSRQSLFTEHYFINYKGDDIMKILIPQHYYKYNFLST